MIKAKFIGKDGLCGFKYGHDYVLKEPNLNQSDWKIMVIDVDNDERWCAYNSVEAFLNHWKVLRCI